MQTRLVLKAHRPLENVFTSSVPVSSVQQSLSKDTHIRIVQVFGAIVIPLHILYKTPLFPNIPY